jgi:hypothetical protein
MSLEIVFQMEDNCDMVHIASFLENKEQLLDRDEVVIPHPHATVRFDYPLQGEHLFQVHGTEWGITRGQLVDFICTQYKTMYQEEEAALGPMSTMEENMAKSFKSVWLMNSERTHGPYGIWGHEVEDLVLEEISYDIETNTVDLGIGS